MQPNLAVVDAIEGLKSATSPSGVVLQSRGWSLAGVGLSLTAVSMADGNKLVPRWNKGIKEQRANKTRKKRRGYFWRSHIQSFNGSTNQKLELRARRVSFETPECPPRPKRSRIRGVEPRAAERRDSPFRGAMRVSDVTATPYPMNRMWLPLWIDGEHRQTLA